MGFWIETTLEVASIATGILIGLYWEEIPSYYKKIKERFKNSLRILKNK